MPQVLHARVSFFDEEELKSLAMHETCGILGLLLHKEKSYLHPWRTDL
jgi:hypothetical protein